MSKIASLSEASDQASVVNACIGQEDILKHFEALKDDITALESFAPDIVVVDTEEEHSSGFDIVSDIRSSDTLRNTPVIVISSFCRSADRTSGFASGADAYLCKPFEPVELEAVFNRMKRVHNSYAELTDQREQAEETAWTVMRSNAELGGLIQFSRGMHQIKAPDDLFELSFAVLAQYGLQATVLARLSYGEIISRTDKQAFTKAEKAIFDNASEQDRIVAQKRLCLFNYPHVAILIRNMPEDESSCGRIRDNIAILVEMMEASVRVIEFEHLRKKRLEESKNQINQNLDATLNELIRLVDESHQNSRSNMEALTDSIEHSFLFLGLSEDQENQIRQYVEHAKAAEGEAFDLSMKIEGLLASIADDIQKNYAAS